MVQRDTTPIATGHARGGPHVHAHAGEGALGISGKILGQGRQQARACLEQNDARTEGSILRKSLANVCRATSEMAPAMSTPVAPPPTMTNVSKRCRSAS